MLSNITQSPLRLYGSIPPEWEARPEMIHYHKADPAIHHEDGWRNYVRPDFDPATHRMGELIYEEKNEMVTHEVIEKTPEELTAERKALVPASIGKLQAMIMLSRMGIKDQVMGMVNGSDNQEVMLYFEYAATWERSSPIINGFAPALGMSQQDLDNFFIEASKIT